MVDSCPACLYETRLKRLAKNKHLSLFIASATKEKCFLIFPPDAVVVVPVGARTDVTLTVTGSNPVSTGCRARDDVIKLFFLRQ
jgi:hypothetical protein